MQFGYHFTPGIYSDLPGTAKENQAFIHRLTSLLGTEHRSALSMWAIPDSADFSRVRTPNLPGTFLQAAGTAEAMTIEWRRLDDDGEERLYSLGHGGPRNGEPAVRIEFNGGQNHTLVYPDEVFDATEAGDIFFAYFQTERVPDKYVLRLFDLDAPFEDQRGSAS
ncbi:hypothetical protein OVA26_01885 [Microbacterium sp. SL62]|uniref:hypothetical protein n=1 Tax=Microbacterium sp. SL62 TaxID=2995139 RepID=UPI0022736B48|nr:hypothetical protein [Microbacterium sp. SL62]MCY1715693.1 hypothetical protein [Microbacterium sp. SL62]